ncbi:hypothetical protein [Cupriavidus campinensis]
MKASINDAFFTFWGAYPQTWNNQDISPSQPPTKGVRMENSNFRNELSALQYMVAALVETHPDKVKLLAVYNSITDHAINDGLFGNNTDAAIESFTSERSRWITMITAAIGSHRAKP